MQSTEAQKEAAALFARLYTRGEGTGVQLYCQCVKHLPSGARHVQVFIAPTFGRVQDVTKIVGRIIGSKQNEKALGFVVKGTGFAIDDYIFEGMQQALPNHKVSCERL